jgi:cAMP-binding proteins - catabolite gene activator and regulatory subunit of cAMP-dependent protein kinases
MLNGGDMAFIGGCLPFLETLGEADRQTIIQIGIKSVFHTGEIIRNREKECNGVVLVNKGQLRAYFESEDGKEITLYRLLSLDVCILTASCVLRNITFEVTLEAEKESAVYFIPASFWAALVQKNSAARDYSTGLVNERFSEVMWVMEQMVSRNMGQRVAAFLLEQSVLEDSRMLDITHDTIAKNLGTAREVVSRILKYLQNDGLLTLSRGRIALSDLDKLHEMSR